MHLKTMLRRATQEHYQLIIRAFMRLHNKRKNAVSGCTTLPQCVSSNSTSPASPPLLPPYASLVCVLTLTDVCTDFYNAEMTALRDLDVTTLFFAAGG